MTSIDLDDYIPDYIPKEESESSPTLSLFQHLYQSPAGAAVAPPPPARLPPASTTDDDEQPGPRFKDQTRPDLLQPATVPSAIREQPTIPLASALLVPESQIKREERVRSELERRLDLEQQQFELDRQRLELLQQQEQLRERQELEREVREQLLREKQELERQQQELQEVGRQQQQQDPHQNDQSVSKKQWIGGMVLVVVLVVLVAAAAGFCGTGNCRGSSPSPSTLATERTSPTMATAVPVSTSPSIISSQVPFPNQTDVHFAAASPSVAPEVTSRIVPSDVTRTSPPSNQPVPVSVSTPATTIDVPTDQLVPLPPLSPNVPTILPVPMPILRPIPAPTARPQLVPMPTLRPILPPTARPQPVPMPTLRPMPSPMTPQPVPVTLYEADTSAPNMLSVLSPPCEICGCSFCPPGFVVGNPGGVIPIPQELVDDQGGISEIPCSLLDFAGASGQIPEDMCNDELRLLPELQFVTVQTCHLSNSVVNPKLWNLCFLPR